MRKKTLGIQLTKGDGAPRAWSPLSSTVEPHACECEGTCIYFDDVMEGFEWFYERGYKEVDPITVEHPDGGGRFQWFPAGRWGGCFRPG